MRLIYASLIFGALCTSSWAVDHPANNGEAEAKAYTNAPASVGQPSNPTAPVNVYVYPAPIPQEQPKTNKANAKQKTQNGGGNKWSDPVVVLTIILAIANIALVVITQKQFWLARDNAISTQRAFVFPKEVVCNVLADPAGSLASVNITLVWENSGETPTRKLQTQLNWRVDQSLPDDFDFNDFPGGIPVISLIPPKSASVTQTVNVPVGNIAMVLAGIHRCYIWGWAEYNDVFKKTPRHRTEFCYEIRMIPNPAVPLAISFRTDHYPKHNGANEDCIKKPRTS